MNTAIVIVLTLFSQQPDFATDESLSAPEPLIINILAEQPPPGCEASEGDEIIVCAEPENNDRHRLRPLSNEKQYKKERPKAEITLDENIVLAGENEAAYIGPGIPSNRVMIRVKLAF